MLKSKKRGQAGLEAMVAMGIIFALFLGVFIIYVAKNGELFGSDRNIAERADCLHVSNLATSAFVLGHGTEMETLVYHNLTIEPSTNRIATDHWFCTIPISSVSQYGTNNDSSYLLQSGRVQISNIEGRIIIDNV